MNRIETFYGNAWHQPALVSARPEPDTDKKTPIGAITAPISEYDAGYGIFGLKNH